MYICKFMCMSGNHRCIMCQALEVRRNLVGKRVRIRIQYEKMKKGTVTYDTFPLRAWLPLGTLLHTILNCFSLPPLH